MDDNNIMENERIYDISDMTEDELVRRYGRLVRVCARPYFLAGGEAEDLIQEGMFGLLKAIRTFDSAKDTSFDTYAIRCIRNRIIEAARTATRLKKIPLNDYVPLDSTELEGEGMSRDPEEVFIARESANAVTESLFDSLSKFETQILGLYLDGYSYTEIAEKVNKSPKSVDNAVQRIRNKAQSARKNQR